jgi:hypothetical protein
MTIEYPVFCVIDTGATPITPRKPHETHSKPGGLVILGLTMSVHGAWKREDSKNKIGYHRGIFYYLCHFLERRCALRTRERRTDSITHFLCSRCLTAQRQTSLVVENAAQHALSGINYLQVDERSCSRATYCGESNFILRVKEELLLVGRRLPSEEVK